jgi:hypothetical protein
MKDIKVKRSRSKRLSNVDQLRNSHCLDGGLEYALPQVLTLQADKVSVDERSNLTPSLGQSDNSSF